MGIANPWARYWAVDLHVHTPASADANEADFGEPIDIVRSAIAAKLDCIAITDHNRADWCDRMAFAAAGFDLVVLPGFELSTKDGHLLGIWEQGTAGSVIEDVGAGFSPSDKLEWLWSRAAIQWQYGSSLYRPPSSHR